MDTKALIEKKDTHALADRKEQLQNLIEKKIIGKKSKPPFELDFIASALLPSDLPISLKNVSPIKTTGNGNCLYNAASLGLIGDETLATALRELTATELFLNAENIANHEIFGNAVQHPDAGLTLNTYQSISLPDDGLKCYDTHGDFSQAIERTYITTCIDKTWASLIHVIALSSALNRPIISIYPNVNKSIRPLFHAKITPAKQHAMTQMRKSEEPLTIMWSRDGDLVSRAGATFEPNHFVLVTYLATENEFEDDIPDMLWLSLSEKETNLDVVVTEKMEHDGDILKYNEIKQRDENGYKDDIKRNEEQKITDSQENKEKEHEEEKEHLHGEEGEKRNEEESKDQKEQIDENELEYKENICEEEKEHIDGKGPEDEIEKRNEKDGKDQKERIDENELKDKKHIGERENKDGNECKEEIEKRNEKEGKDQKEQIDENELKYKEKEHEAEKEHLNGEEGEKRNEEESKDQKEQIDENELKVIENQWEEEKGHIDEKGHEENNEKRNEKERKDQKEQIDENELKDKNHKKKREHTNDHECKENEMEHGEEKRDSGFTTSDEIPLARILAGPKRKYTNKDGPPTSEYSTSDEIPIASLIPPKGSFNKKKRKTLSHSDASRSWNTSPNSSSEDEDIESKEDMIEYDSDKDFHVIADISDFESGEEGDDDDDEAPTFTGDIKLTWSRKLQKVPKKTFTRPKPGVAVPLSSITKELDFFYEILAKEGIKKDPLYKVSPLMEGVRKNSIRKYNLHQEVSVDEAMIKCHDQHWTIVGAPNKPAKRGFKIFVAADTVTGFMWNFQVYFRKKKEIGLTQRVVENLTEGIAYRNHIIFVDKFYTSVPLALSLLEKSTFICGSFNTGRKHWPADLKVDKKKKKKEDKIRTLERGQYLTRQTADGNLVATVWQDSRTVFNLSTCHNPITNSRRDTVERKHVNAAAK